jgi:hypothetical protein
VYRTREAQSRADITAVAIDRMAGTAERVTRTLSA